MFSDAELQLASNQEVILTKNRIIGKVYDQFGVLAQQLSDDLGPLREVLPQETSVTPKISKGELYEQLPWVMLDYPRWYSHQMGHLAIRVMFWWGNYFLVQLQVSRNYLLPVVKKAEDWLKAGKFSEAGWYLGFPEDPWNFRLPQSGLMLPEDFLQTIAIPEKGIFKVVKKEPLEGAGLMPALKKTTELLLESLVPRP